MKKWLSPLPEKCEICGKKFGAYFYDSKTMWGCWGLLCESCWKAHNGKVGQGIAQKYITETKEGVDGF